jgi:hypothetical protein
MGAGYHNRKQIERAIADDLAFLAAHPVRQSSLRASMNRRHRSTGTPREAGNRFANTSPAPEFWRAFRDRQSRLKIA